MKILQTLKSDIVQEAVSCFGNLEATCEQISTAGNTIMLSIYNGKEDDTLTTLRHANWHLMVLGKKKRKLEPWPRLGMQCTSIHSGCITSYVNGLH